MFCKKIDGMYIIIEIGLEELLKEIRIYLYKRRGRKRRRFEEKLAFGQI